MKYYKVLVTFVQRHMKGCSNKSTLEREQTSLTRFDAGEDIWLRSLKNLLSKISAFVDGKTRHSKRIHPHQCCICHLFLMCLAYIGCLLYDAFLE